MTNFWQKFDKPILALAPMAGVTDGAFREICAEFGADVTYTEMANVKALTFESQKTLDMLKDKNRTAPLVVQLFGNDPTCFQKAIKLVEEKIKPAGIDINFGCPAPKIIKTKAGAELFQDLDLSYQVIRASLEATQLPISIKVRIKVGKVDIFTFLDKIKTLDVKAIMVHGRSFSQGFSGEIDTSVIKQVKQIFLGKVLANGGIYTQEKAYQILTETGADGLGIARGAMGNPWLFKELKEQKNLNKSRTEIFQVALRQAKLNQALKGDRGIIEMRKHLCWYTQGLTGAKDMRRQLVEVKTLKDIERIFKV